ncbi:MAG: DUF3791 domain-containing protein [Propionibacteriaceae bacterium]|nr:DUF3791 domain-containing protein [Propionibacteriaceae bacterium]
MAERARDENLLVVAAVEGYSRRRRVPARDTILTFASVGLLRLIRDSYPVLHTQSLDESVDFAEDVLTRSGVQLADSYPGSNAEGSVSDERFMYKDQDVTLDVTLKIEHVVNIIAREQCLGFDDAYEDFVSSRTYQALQKPMSLMWAESAEYIVDRYLEEWSDRQHDLPVAASREAS